MWFKDHNFPVDPESEDVMDMAEVVSLDHLKSPVAYNNEDELIEDIDNQWLFDVDIDHDLYGAWGVNR